MSPRFVFGLIGVAVVSAAFLLLPPTATKAPVKAPNPWFFAERAYPQGEIPTEAWQQAQIQAKLMRDDAEGKSRAAWQQRGPLNVGGRITDLAVDPNNENIVFAGAAEGGVLRSRDGGQTWDTLSDDWPSLSIGTVAIDPGNPATIYAGTGEVNPGGGSIAYGGAGVFRSTDQGDTWTNIGLENSGSIGRIRIDPTDPDRIFVAVMGHTWQTGPDRGVYRSTDGGATWENVLAIDETTGCVDLIMRPDDPDVLLAAMWQRLREPASYSYGGIGCGVYRSDDGGDTWTLSAGGLPAPSSDGGRIGLSLCESQPSVMHAIYADRIGYFDGLYRSTNGGLSWTRTNDFELNDVFSSYGWWFGNVRTHPLNPDIIYVLGLEFYRSINGGASYHNSGHIMHVDHHGLDFGPGPNPTVYNGNDGGVYRSFDTGVTWAKSPIMPITQIYRIGLDANNPDALYCGVQDNGTRRTLTGAVDDFEFLYGGDGFQPLVHPENSNKIWVQYQYGNVAYSSNNGGTFYTATTGIGDDRVGWNAPHVQDPTDADQRYFGTKLVYRSTGPYNWTPISGDLTYGPHSGVNGQVNGTLTTLAVSPQDGEVIWAGSDDGRVSVTTSGGGFWTDVSAGVPDRWITAVRCDPDDRETAYITVSGFRHAEPLPHVLKTTDLGQTWQPIAGNLPEAPVNDLVIDPEQPGHLYVATDVGVYFTTGNAQWATAGTGLPNVVVTSLALEPTTRMLMAGTYGRSFFALELDDVSAAPDDPDASVATNARGTLEAPFPNPASGTTRIAWNLPRAAQVTLDVYTVSGRRVFSKTVAATAGAGNLAWHGKDRQGRRLATGAYLMSVLTDGQLLGSKTVILKR